MVGRRGRQGSPAAGLTASVQAAYDATAGTWADGPERMYAPLAQALVAASGVLPAGRMVLDLGAGTGTAGRAAQAAGARLVVAADIAVGMLRQAAPSLQAVAADATALPFRDRAFDLVVAAFCLNHLPDIPAALREARRVSPAISASLFAPGWTHPAKEAVDEALAHFGYRQPAWYATFKTAIEPQAADPELLAGRAAAAGFSRVRLRTVSVPTGLSTPAQLASWRLGMAHVAPFLQSLDPPRRADLQRAAEHAVAGTGPLVVAMVVLTAG